MEGKASQERGEVEESGSLYAVKHIGELNAILGGHVKLSIWETLDGSPALEIEGLLTCVEDTDVRLGVKNITLRIEEK